MRALPLRPPRDTRGRCTYGFRRYCSWPLLQYPHDEGLEAMGKIRNKRIDPEIPTAHIVDLAELVLKKNNF